MRKDNAKLLRENNELHRDAITQVMDRIRGCSGIGIGVSSTMRSKRDRAMRGQFNDDGLTAQHGEGAGGGV